MKFMFLLCGDEAIGEMPSRISEERSAQWNDFHRLTEESAKIVRWHTLVPTGFAKTVRPNGNSLVHTDGPYTETKEQFGGVYILECADIDEALQFADRMPCAVHGGVEGRQMLSE